MQRYRRLALAASLGVVLLVTPGSAQEGDDAAAQPVPAAEQVTRASKDVPELILGSKDDQFTVSQKDFVLMSGQGYRWKISAAGGFEYKFHTDLFRNVWMNQIVINDLETHERRPAWLGYDADGTIQVQFSTVRRASTPGRRPISLREVCKERSPSDRLRCGLDFWSE